MLRQETLLCQVSGGQGLFGLRVAGWCLWWRKQFAQRVYELFGGVALMRLRGCGLLFRKVLRKLANLSVNKLWKSPQASRIICYERYELAMDGAVKGLEAIGRSEATGGCKTVECFKAFRDPVTTGCSEGVDRFREGVHPAASAGSEVIGYSEIHGQLCEMMRLNMEIDDLYEKHASKSSVSPTAFWLLYALMENGGGRPLTQRRFCKEWSYSPQTVNSCLKKLQRDGLVSLVSLPGSKKEKASGSPTAAKRRPAVWSAPSWRQRRAPSAPSLRRNARPPCACCATTWLFWMRRSRLSKSSASSRRTASELSQCI